MFGRVSEIWLSAEESKQSMVRKYCTYSSNPQRSKHSKYSTYCPVIDSEKTTDQTWFIKDS